MGHRVARALAAALLAGSAGAKVDIRFDIDIGKDNHAISPLIFGVNGAVPGPEDGATFLRSGGNRLTAYNWENNASNAGSDYLHNSDSYLGGGLIPGKAITDFHDLNPNRGIRSLVTLQAAGFVARDKKGPVSEGEKAPSARWVPVVFEKGKAFADPPDTADNAVYMDEFVSHLVKKYGPASVYRGVHAYAMDNEPALWPSTHARVHPAKTGAAEVATRNAGLAKAVKQVDSTALIFGGVFYGYMEFLSMQDAPDWAALKSQGNYAWYVDYFLDQLKKSSDAAGRRLLDVLDLHWYPEARGDNRITEASATTAADIAARLQAPRSLWDSTYKENSWITQVTGGPISLLPRVLASIRKYFPGTRLAVTEYNYGGASHVSGGLATADFLGTAARLDLYATCYWPLEDARPYVVSAFRLFRNYDGKASRFGDVNAQAVASDREKASVFAGYTPGDSAIHVIVINKSAAETIQGNFQVTSPSAIKGVKAWGFDQGGSALAAKAAVGTVSGNTFTYALPPLSAYHLVLETATPLPASIRPAHSGTKPRRAGSVLYTPDGRAVKEPEAGWAKAGSKPCFPCFPGKDDLN